VIVPANDNPARASAMGAKAFAEATDVLA